MKSKLFRVLAFLAVLISSSVLVVPISAQSDGEFIYLLVEPRPSDSTITEEETTISEPPRVDPFLLQFRKTEVVGLVFTSDTRITIYTNSNSPVFAEAYAISPDVSTGGYLLRGDTKIPIVTASTVDQNVYNNDFLVKYPNLDVDATSYFATRPLDILGRDEIVIIGKGGGFSTDTVKGVVAFDFRNFSFQIAQLRGRTVEFGIPSVIEPISYSLIANKEADITEITRLADGKELEQTAKTYERQALLEILGQEPVELFDRMRILNVRIFPFHGYSETYTPKRLFRIDMVEQARLREFNVGDIVRPLEGASPGLIIAAGGGVYDPPVLPAAGGTVQDVLPTGELVVKRQGGEVDEIVEAWLVE